MDDWKVRSLVGSNLAGKANPRIASEYDGRDTTVAEQQRQSGGSGCHTGVGESENNRVMSQGSKLIG